MKITWFGGEAFRFHVGGEIVALDADGAADGFDATELASGADQVLRSVDLPRIELTKWAPRPALPPIAEAESSGNVKVHRGKAGSVLVDAQGEPPLVVVRSPVKLGPRWAAQAIVVTFAATGAASVLGPASPRLIALAAGDPEITTTMQVLSERLNSTVLVALEPGMALEV